MAEQTEPLSVESAAEAKREQRAEKARMREQSQTCSEPPD